jgi:hypothetical protein
LSARRCNRSRSDILPFRRVLKSSSISVGRRIVNLQEGSPTRGLGIVIVIVLVLVLDFRTVFALPPSKIEDEHEHDNEHD